MKLARYLERYDVSQGELAERAGLSRKTINNAVHERFRLRLETIEAIINATDAVVDWCDLQFKPDGGQR